MPKYYIRDKRTGTRKEISEAEAMRLAAEKQRQQASGT